MAWSDRSGRRRWGVALLTALLTGCGGGAGDYDLAPVTGRVTVDGKPFAAGKVMFAPIGGGDSIESGKPAFGQLDADGRFTLGTYREGDGAVVGDHRVTLFRVDDGPNGPADGSVPDFKRMVLRGAAISVSAGGPNEIEIALTSDELRKHGSDR